MTPPDEPPSNPYDPNWPKPEQPYGQQPASQPPADEPTAPYAPYGQEQPYGQAPSGQQQPYGQAPYGQVPYGAPSYGGPMAPKHPSATTAMVLGIGALGGVAFCVGITLPLSPFAWFIGGRAVKEIDANPGRYSGRDQAQAGRIMGMIGTGLLVLGLVFLTLLIVGLAVSDTSSSTSDSSF